MRSSRWDSVKGWMAQASECMTNVSNSRPAAWFANLSLGTTVASTLTSLKSCLPTLCTGTCNPCCCCCIGAAFGEMYRLTNKVKEQEKTIKAMAKRLSELESGRFEQDYVLQQQSYVIGTLIDETLKGSVAEKCKDVMLPPGKGADEFSTRVIPEVKTPPPTDPPVRRASIHARLSLFAHPAGMPKDAEDCILPDEKEMTLALLAGIPRRKGSGGDSDEEFDFDYDVGDGARVGRK